MDSCAPGTEGFLWSFWACFSASDPLLCASPRSVPRLGDLGSGETSGECHGSHAAGRRLAGHPPGPNSRLFLWRCPQRQTADPPLSEPESNTPPYFLCGDFSCGGQRSTAAALFGFLMANGYRKPVHSPKRKQAVTTLLLLLKVLLPVRQLNLGELLDRHS